MSYLSIVELVKLLLITLFDSSDLTLYSYECALLSVDMGHIIITSVVLLIFWDFFDCEDD